MPLIGSYRQQPNDTLDYDITFDKFLPPDDTISAATVNVVPADLGTSFAIEGRRVKVWCYGGTNGTKYKITVLATTFDGREKEVEFKLTVKDD